MDIFLTRTMKELRASSVYASLPRDRNKSTLGKTDLCVLMAEHLLPSKNAEVRVMKFDLRQIITIVETPDGHIPADGAT